MRRLCKRASAVILSTAMVFSGIQISGIRTEAAQNSDFTTDLFGSNVFVFDDKDSESDIQQVIDNVYGVQETNQFGQERYALLFKPGNYESVRAKVGFYTQVAGLGENPTDTVVNELDCNADWMGANATCNFWRSAENFTVSQTATWAAAQATSLRRMNFENWVALDQWGQGWASGGFVSDTVVKGQAVAWSEQQFCSRNSEYSAWQGGVWNAVFIGMNSDLTDNSGNKVESNWDNFPGYQYYTNVEKTPVIREQPYITVDDNDNYSVFVPSKRTDVNGVSWKDGNEAGKSISIDKFYIAKPEKDNADTINNALSSGKNLIFTPGIYKVDKPINVTKKDTVVLGMGYATLTPTGNNECMKVADVDGVSVSGLLFDAGPDYTDNLLEVGEQGSTARHASNPTLLSDLFFRVGGVTSSVAQSKTCITINSNDVIGDNFWVWRADHGDGVAWDLNKSKNGIVINGDYMTMYGLFVEHFHEYQTVWNGDYGRLYFYQSEIPYDVPNQAAWKSHDNTVDGYSSLKVADDVKSYEAYGLGIYSYHRDATVNLENAIEVPDADNVSVHNACTVMLAGNPGISHVINGQGDAVTIAGERQQVVLYGQGKVEVPEEPEEEKEIDVKPTINTADSKVKIVSPEYNKLLGAGDVKIKWNAPARAGVKDYLVYVDGEKVATTTNTEFEYYTTKVAVHKIVIATEYNDGNISLSKEWLFAITKKGLCVNNQMGGHLTPDTMNVGWYYNWQSEAFDNANYNNIEYIPMVWGAGDEENTINKILTKNPNYLLAYNEPDMSWNNGGSNISVDTAINNWDIFKKYKSNYKLGAPAPALSPSWDGGTWFRSFMDRVDTDSIDFIPLHCYYDKYGGSAGAKAFLTDVVDKTYEMYHKPIWITEFAVNGWGYDNENGKQSLQEFMRTVIEGLNQREYVERYAWFSFDTTDGYNGAAALWTNATGELTKLGKTYVNSGNPKGYDPTLTEPEDNNEEIETTQSETTEAETKAPETTQEPLNVTNIALNKKAYSSAVIGANTADLAVDGNDGSRWESIYEDNQYMYVDLGSICKVNGVNINWERAAGKEYTIDISDNAKDWKTIYTVNDGKEGNISISFPLVNTRYVRVNGITRTTGYGFSIWELQIMGVEGNKQTETTKPAETTKQPETTKEPETTKVITTNTTNYAKGGKVTVSSTEGPFVGENAVDGNDGSRWSSEFTDNQWIAVDLGSIKDVSKVVLNWEAAYGKSYNIQVSTNGTDWKTVATENNSDGGIDTLSFAHTNARYVRMQGVSRATGYGYSLFEFEVY